MSDYYQQQLAMYLMRRARRPQARQAGAGDESPQPPAQPGLLSRLRRSAARGEQQPERRPRPRRRQSGLAESG